MFPIPYPTYYEHLVVKAQTKALMILLHQREQWHLQSYSAFCLLSQIRHIHIVNEKKFRKRLFIILK